MTGNEKQEQAERETRNRGLQEEDERLHDADRRPPRTAAEQSGPRPERPSTLQEDADEDVAHLENPPQAEGPREQTNEGV